MKFKALVVILLVVLCGCRQPPDFVDTDGKDYRYADIQGSWQVINYWATWCAPCIREIPELIRLHENNDNVIVFGVNFDAPEGDEVASQIKTMGITFPVYQEDPYAHLGFDVPAVLPTTVLIDPEGKLAGVLVGPQTEASLLSAMGIKET
ncbi:MAG: TlpA family protein disulfide reductase [Gammaproteobacteria bacterium]|nr:TlpA family protein disulfide reductase [Gammaproteobacteria bacterium]